MQSIPLQAVPAQIVSVVLAGQNCQIHVFQKSTGLFVDLSVNNNRLLSTRLARNAVPLVRHKYFGMIGDLMFLDMQGMDDPYYSGLDSRFKLVYIEGYEL